MSPLTQRIDRWLWPAGERPEDAPLWCIVCRYAYALGHDIAGGDLSLRAMSLVYTTMLAIVPLLAFSFSLLKGLGVHNDLGELLRRILTPHLGADNAETLTTQLVDFVDKVNGSTLASVSIALLLFSALSMAQKVEASFNFVWRVDRPRSFARRFSEYLSVMLVGPLIMFVAFGFTATLASTALVGRLEQLGAVGRWIASVSNLTPYALVIAAFSFLYVFVPNTRVRLKPALAGGLFGGVLWAASASLFTTFVASASTPTAAIYSGFAIVLVAMIWLYLSWLIILLGTQLAFYLQNPGYLRLRQRSEQMSNALRERLALAVMLLVGRDFEKPGHGWRIESLAALLRLPRHFVEPVVGALSEAGLLARTTEQRLIPARDLRRVPLAEILAVVRNPAGEVARFDDIEPTLDLLSARIDRGIAAAFEGRSLADLVESGDGGGA